MRHRQAPAKETCPAFHFTTHFMPWQRGEGQEQGAGEGALLHFTPAGWQRAEQEERARRRSMAAKVRNLFGKNPFRE